MVQYLEQYKKNIVTDMRKRGFSYTEIQNRLHVPKSTLSFWLKNLKLTPEQSELLKSKRLDVIKTKALKKISRTSRLIEEIKNKSSQDIGKISKKELWLMGIILYWKNGNKSDLKKGVHFSSSNPDLVKLFLKWLKEVGCVEDGEIKFTIFLNKKKETKTEDSANSRSVSHWSKVTGFPINCFNKIYFKKGGISNLGFLRIKVTQSSMLARQINGWIEGLKQRLLIIHNQL